MRRTSPVVLLLAFVLIVSACSGGDGEASTTTTAVDAGTVTSLGAAGGDEPTGATDTTAPPAAGDTTTTVAGGNPPIPQFEILEREPGEEGDTVVVLLDPTSYTSLNDIDLRNVIAEVADEYAPVYEAHVIDDERVAPLLAQEELTLEEEQLLDNYYLARLEEGFRIVFVGPFDDVASTVLGS